MLIPTTSPVHISTNGGDLLIGQFTQLVNDNWKGARIPLY